MRPELQIVIRADASYSIGHGHVMRCLTLASALREHGARVLFVCRDHPGHLSDLIVSRGFAVQRLPWLPTGGGGNGRAALLGATPREDAVATREAVERVGESADWLIADHYGINAEWERVVRPAAKRILVVDDLADRIHECDLLLDQNYVKGMDTRYDGLVTDSCGRLLGPAYALLQREYAELHVDIPPRAGVIHRLLISFGGADRNNLSGRALSAVLAVRHPDLYIDVVLSAGSQNLDAVERVAAGQQRVAIHHALPSLAPLIARADLGIGAGGATNWERLCLGLPSLVITLADNQRPIAEKLHDGGFVEWIGDEATVDETRIAGAVSELLNCGIDRDWSLRCLGLVDGRGAERVATIMAEGAPMPLRARAAAIGDEALLFEWVNDPITRASSFSPERILPESHRAWFRSKLQTPEVCRLYLVETTEGTSVGQVRFDWEPDGWVIDYAVAPVFRGRGVARMVLAAALRELKLVTGGGTIFGVVKRENAASNRVFESLGFRRSESANGFIWSRTE